VLASGVKAPSPPRDLAAPTLAVGPKTFAWGARTYVMGVINVSPDSFSGDGIADPDAALEQARRFVREGADLLDVGGQSTRPAADRTRAGFDEVDPREEIRRVVPVIERLRRELPDVPVSVDTYKPEVARPALAAGAHMLNDIYGFRHDPTLARTAAEHGVPAVVMHNQRGRPETDVVAGVIAGIRESVRIAAEAGLPRERLVADPGFGFGWTPEQNVEMLRRLPELAAIGLPLLVGTSRKSTIGTLLGDAPAGERLWGTAASVALSIAGGAHLIRVHDVGAMKQVALVSDAIVRGRPREDG
jgi:dihydropteroate synthase